MAGLKNAPSRMETIMTIAGAPSMSIIIPAHCSEARHGTSRLQLTLLSLCRPTARRDAYEVILVDNASEPALAPQVAAWGLADCVRVIRREQTGFASGYNIGIAAARAPVTLLGTDDELVAPGMLDLHLSAHECGPASLVFGHCMVTFHTELFHDVITAELVPGVLAQVGAKAETDWLPGAAAALDLTEKAITVDDVVHRFDRVLDLAGTLAQMEDIERAVASGRAHSMPGGWLAMRVGNHSVPTDILKEVGGFDAKFDEYGGWYSDIDLGLRLADAGVEYRYAADAISVNINHPRTPGPMLGTVAGMAYLIAKHRRMEVALSPLYFQHRMPLMGYSALLRRALRERPDQKA